MARKKSKNRILAMPQESRVEVGTQQSPKMSFDAWYALRSGMIPAQHHKEIIRADFRARKINDLSTLEEFDEALKKYGVKLQ